MNVVLLLSAFQMLAAALDQPSRWEAQIRAFERNDLAQPPPRGGLLFAGSSSIHLWSTLEEDFKGYPVIRRGFGGSEMRELVWYASRIIHPYLPRMILVYEGDNDLANGRSPEQVHRDFVDLIRVVRARLPECRIAFISIKPSPARWHLREAVQKANERVMRECAADPKLDYVDVFTPMLGADGGPREELFVADRLHLNTAGYALWARIIREHLPARGTFGEPIAPP